VAALRRITVGDVIAAVGDRRVAAPQDVAEGLRVAVARKAPLAALLVAGERGTRWVTLPLEADR
jgi:hypothetical protein